MKELLSFLEQYDFTWIMIHFNFHLYYFTRVTINLILYLATSLDHQLASVLVQSLSELDCSPSMYAKSCACKTCGMISNQIESKYVHIAGIVCNYIKVWLLHSCSSWSLKFSCSSSSPLLTLLPSAFPDEQPRYDPVCPWGSGGQRGGGPACQVQPSTGWPLRCQRASSHWWDTSHQVWHHRRQGVRVIAIYLHIGIFLS